MGYKVAQCVESASTALARTAVLTNVDFYLCFDPVRNSFREDKLAYRVSPVCLSSNPVLTLLGLRAALNARPTLQEEFPDHCDWERKRSLRMWPVSRKFELVTEGAATDRSQARRKAKKEFFDLWTGLTTTA